MSLLAELKRRNVVKAAVLYVVASWLILQIADVGVSLLGLPDWVGKSVFLLLVLGLPLVLIFSWVYELTPEGLKREKDVDQNLSSTAETGRKINVLIVVLLVLAIATVIIDRLVPESATAVRSPVPDEVEKVIPATGQSIAVLPFVNMSNDPEQEYFSDGISEELLNVLARYPDLRVAARTSSFQFKGQTPDIADIATTLHVNHVLEGSVRKSGNTLRITAQLIEAESGFHLWSETFDRQLTDVFAIQDEISAAIGEALKIQLALSDDTGPSSPTVPVAATAAAFDAYVHGRQLINLRGQANLEQAVVYLEKAIALDESYAPAHAQLAIAYALLSDSPGSYGDLTIEDVKQMAIPHIDRAFDLDPSLAEGFAARAILDLTASDFEASVANAERTLELNPSYADAWNWLYISSMGIGRYVEAGEALKRLLRVDPLSVIGRHNRAGKLALEPGQKQAALELADNILRQSLPFEYFTRAQIAYYAGESDEALKWGLKSLHSGPVGAIAADPIGRTMGQLDMLAEALRSIDGAHYWAYLNQRMWPDLIALSRQRLERDTSNANSKLLLANALHLSGDIEQAQVLYEEILATVPGLAIIDQNSESVAPTARAALGRLRAGDEEGARELIELTQEDLRQRRRAEYMHGEYYRAAAIIAALREDNEEALENLERWIEWGPRDPSIFSEPAFEPLRDSAGFQALESRLESILAAQRGNALQMICLDNPVADAWQPLPETCAGVERH
jgi:TolB-like protein/cytochrome c-type biogenesis protein CcmH/NrfG